MADILEYKCPACGGAMEFDSKSQKMKCPFCDTEMDVEEFQRQNKASGTQEDRENAGEGMVIYACKSCGGEIVATENTGASSCPFCGNPVVLKGQFEGELRPDYIIPFKKDKKDAKKAYQKHLEGKTFLPKVFRQENYIDEIKGMYVPFWLFDMDASADIDYKAQIIRTWRNGDTEYTETKYYSVERSGNMGFVRVPADGSKKIDDVLMESVEPFDFKESVSFEPAYLAGYVAERYDVPADACRGNVKKRVKKSVENTFRSSVKGYDIVSVQSSTVNIKEKDCKYALYPVWMLSTTWREKQFLFVMNAQNGKFIGDLPVDRGAFWKYTVKWGALFSVIVYVLSFILL